MKFLDFEKIMSNDRTQRYCNACYGDTKKAMMLYRENLRLSQEMFTIISCFEIALRNAINKKLIEKFGGDWLRDSVKKGGIFSGNKFEGTKRVIENAYCRLKSKNLYSHSKLLAEMEFGVWKYMFSNPQYKMTGRILLGVFPNRPKSSALMQYNNVYFFNELDGLNTLRNRIAHHEPICFKKGSDSIDTSYILAQYNRVKALFLWMGIDSTSLLYGLDHVNQVSMRVGKMKR